MAMFLSVLSEADGIDNGNGIVRVHDNGSALATVDVAGDVADDVIGADAGFGGDIALDYGCVNVCDCGGVRVGDLAAGFGTVDDLGGVLGYGGDLDVAAGFGDVDALDEGLGGDVGLDAATDVVYVNVFGFGGGKDKADVDAFGPDTVAVDVSDFDDDEADGNGCDNGEDEGFGGGRGIAVVDVLGVSFGRVVGHDDDEAMVLMAMTTI